MSKPSILAIDFGTTNSYFCKCPADQISPVGVDFGSGRDGIPTAILYRQDKEPLVGNPALHEYGASSNEAPERYPRCTPLMPTLTPTDVHVTTVDDDGRVVAIEAEAAEYSTLLGFIDLLDQVPQFDHVQILNLGQAQGADAGAGQEPGGPTGGAAAVETSVNMAIASTRSKLVPDEGQYLPDGDRAVAR